jgi:DNA polymerase III delta prime subunit
MTDKNDFLWVERYRPSTLDECILPKSIHTEIAGFIKSGQISNMLFSGTAGTGKTTVAKAICNDIGADALYINMSADTGIDVVRNQITQFASTASFDGNLKIIIGDECLSEHEKVRIGSLDSWVAVPLNQLPHDTFFPVVSFNIDTKEFENDIGCIISDRNDELYEVELDDGSLIVANDQHPFMCVDENGDVVQRTISQGFDRVRIIKQM